VTARAFPVIYSKSVEDAAGFYEALGFERHFQLPADGAPGYVGLRRESYEVAIVDQHWPEEQYGQTMGESPRFEMFVYVDDVESTVEQLRALGARVLVQPTDMPWGEHVGIVADPDGNPVSLALAQS
jgi:lactoylglutathione lyase